MAYTEDTRDLEGLLDLANVIRVQRQQQLLQAMLDQPAQPIRRSSGALAGLGRGTITVVTLLVLVLTVWQLLPPLPAFSGPGTTLPNGTVVPGQQIGRAHV